MQGDSKVKEVNKELFSHRWRVHQQIQGFCLPAVAITETYEVPPERLKLVLGVLEIMLRCFQRDTLRAQSDPGGSMRLPDPSFVCTSRPENCAGITSCLSHAGIWRRHSRELGITVFG